MTTSRQERLARVRIETRLAEAARLLSTARHETIKHQIRLASRDLDEAITWLDQIDVEASPLILKIVDILSDLATRRLTMVADVLTTRGRDATLIG